MSDADIDRLAYMGVEPPGSLDYYQLLRFLMMRSLYQYAKATDMPPEQWAREKMMVEAACKQYRLDRDYAIHCGKVQCAVSMAMCDYRKAETKSKALAAADRIVEALDNVPVRRGTTWKD